MQRSRVLSAEIVEPVVVNVAITPRATSRSNKPRVKRGTTHVYVTSPAHIEMDSHNSFISRHQAISGARFQAHHHNDISYWWNIRSSKIILIGGILVIVGVAMFFNFFYYRVVT